MPATSLVGVSSYASLYGGRYWWHSFTRWTRRCVTLDSLLAACCTRTTGQNPNSMTLGVPNSAGRCYGTVCTVSVESGTNSCPFIKSPIRYSSTVGVDGSKSESNSDRPLKRAPWTSTKQVRLCNVGTPATSSFSDGLPCPAATATKQSDSPSFVDGRMAVASAQAQHSIENSNTATVAAQNVSASSNITHHPGEEGFYTATLPAITVNIVSSKSTVPATLSQNATNRITLRNGTTVVMISADWRSTSAPWAPSEILAQGSADEDAADGAVNKAKATSKVSITSSSVPSSTNNALHPSDRSASATATDSKMGPIIARESRVIGSSEMADSPVVHNDTSVLALAVHLVVKNLETPTTVSQDATTPLTLPIGTPTVTISADRTSQSVLEVSSVTTCRQVESENPADGAVTKPDIICGGIEDRSITFPAASPQVTINGGLTPWTLVSDAASHTSFAGAARKSEPGTSGSNEEHPEIASRPEEPAIENKQPSPWSTTIPQPIRSARAFACSSAVLASAKTSAAHTLKPLRHKKPAAARSLLAATAGVESKVKPATSPKQPRTSLPKAATSNFLKPVKGGPRDAFGEHAPMLLRRPPSARNKSDDGKRYLSYQGDKNYKVYYAAGIEAAEWILRKIKGSVVGFDMEWEITWAKQDPAAPPVSLVQLCDTNGTIALLHVHHMTLPPEFVRILNNPHVLKVGNNIKADITRLRKGCPRWHGSEEVTGDNFLDLGKLASDLGLVKGSRTLDGLCRAILNADLHKPCKTFHVGWGKANLTYRQLKYAADDVYASLVVYERMIQRLNKTEDLGRPTMAAIPAG